MKDYSLYNKALIADKGFPVSILSNNVLSNHAFLYRHWHEQLEILFFKSGKGIIECNSKSFQVCQGDIIVLNSNDLHFGLCTEAPLDYYCIIIDTSLLKGSIDGSCEQKYINPIFQNLILFKNKIHNNQDLTECLDSILNEYENKEIGYELHIKSLVYKLMVILLRKHIERVLKQNEYEIKIKNLERINSVLDYIEKNFTQEITIDILANKCHVNRYHFCHMFKKITGKTVSEYVNFMRINKADQLLINTDMYINEIAEAIGFNDTNYFSRTYKKFRNVSPALARKNLPNI